MSLFIWGLDQVNANLDTRESLFLVQDQIKRFWHERDIKISVLSTCNRFELYGILNDLTVLDEFKFEFSQFIDHAYSYTSFDDYSKHMLDLACGLRSSIVGETEIIKQLNLWITELEPGHVKDQWQQVLTEALDVRKEKFNLKPSVSFAHAVYSDIAERFEYNLPKDVYLIGTGMMAQNIAETFVGRSRCHFITGRNKNRARQIAKLYGGRAYYRSELLKLLPKTQLLISATAAPHRVLTQTNLQGLKRDDLSDLVIYDLAMPRDIDPVLIKIFDLNVTNLDDLKINLAQTNPVGLSV